MPLSCYETCFQHLLVILKEFIFSSDVYIDLTLNSMTLFKTECLPLYIIFYIYVCIYTDLHSIKILYICLFSAYIQDHVLKDNTVYLLNFFKTNVCACGYLWKRVYKVQYSRHIAYELWKKLIWWILVFTFSL